LKQFAYLVYAIGRRTARAIGLAKPIRKYLGPVAGRLVFKVSNDPKKPFSVGGHQMVLAQEGRYPPLAMVQDRYEEGTTRLLNKILTPDMTIIDVGAHVGYYSLQAARQVGSAGRVISFEPEPSNYELLTQNIELNGYSHVKAINKAVSSTVGTTTLYITALDNGRNSMYHHGLPESGSVSVETTTLDSFLESEEWPRVDLVKIDVEGAEVKVLDGMVRLMTDYPDLKLIIELNPPLFQDKGVPPLVFVERLVSRGWSVQVIEGGSGLTPLAKEDAQDLIDRLLATETSVNLFCTRI